MAWGRLIWVRKDRGDRCGVSYIVAVPAAVEAMDLVRRYCAEPDDIIEDRGRVSEELLQALKLLPNQFARADEAGKR